MAQHSRPQQKVAGVFYKLCYILYRTDFRAKDVHVLGFVFYRGGVFFSRDLCEFKKKKKGIYRVL